MSQASYLSEGRTSRAAPGGPRYYLELRCTQVLGPGCLAVGHLGDRGEGVAVEVFAHDVTGLVPHGEQDALTFVVTRTVGVRFAEVAEGDRAVDGGEDLADSRISSGARAST